MNTVCIVSQGPCIVLIKGAMSCSQTSKVIALDRYEGKEYKRKAQKKNENWEKKGTLEKACLARAHC